MGSSTPQSLNCFNSERATRVAGLSAFDRAVLRVLEDARGFYRTSGMLTMEVRNRLPAEYRMRRLNAVRGALWKLEAAGLAERTTDGKWRIMR